MSEQADAVIQQGLALDHRERAQIVAELGESLGEVNPTDPNMDPDVRQAEIMRRAQDLSDNPHDSEPWSRAYEDLRDRLTAKRS